MPPHPPDRPSPPRTSLQRQALLTHLVFHVRRLLRTALAQFELLPALEACTSVDSARDVVRRCRAYSLGELPFVEGAEAARRAADEREARRAANAARRAEFVERMVGKARKEGRADDWYLQVGREPPTAADVLKAQRMADKKAQAGWWRQQFGQHCQGHYVDGVCPHLADSRGCGFLHGGEDNLAS